ncbi:MAG TPA: cytochrome-c oxidase, cbb3-type subunit III [Sphingomonadales bacterium]
MSVGERDPHTGRETTGHEWNGIKELNTPVPKVVWIALLVTFLFSLVYWVLMPAWPLGVTYTRGLLGLDDGKVVAAKVEAAKAARAPWASRIMAADFAEIQRDPALMNIVREAGHPLFADNCAVCHGTRGTGGKGFPNLAANTWLWGGDADAIAETIRVGINSGHEETRVSQMMAFGRDGMLNRKEVLAVVTYVQALSNPAIRAETDAETLELGGTVFADNCAACHGEDARGIPEMGAPDLADDVWIYGGDRQTIFETVWNGRQGHMPHWEGRLSELERKILTLYVLDLAGARP